MQQHYLVFWGDPNQINVFDDYGEAALHFVEEARSDVEAAICSYKSGGKGVEDWLEDVEEIHEICYNYKNVPLDEIVSTLERFYQDHTERTETGVYQAF